MIRGGSYRLCSEHRRCVELERGYAIPRYSLLAITLSAKSKGWRQTEVIVTEIALSSAYSS